MNASASWLAVAGTILLTVYGQFIIKWRMSGVRLAPDSRIWAKAAIILGMFGDPWIWSAILAAFGASVCWMAAMTRLSLSQAYPFTSLTIVLVTVIGMAVLGEAATLSRLAGIGIVILGLIILAR